MISTKEHKLSFGQSAVEPNAVEEVKAIEADRQRLAELEAEIKEWEDLSELKVDYQGEGVNK
jgi:hypothetical protein